MNKADVPGQRRVISYLPQFEAFEFMVGARYVIFTRPSIHIVRRLLAEQTLRKNRELYAVAEAEYQNCRMRSQASFGQGPDPEIERIRKRLHHIAESVFHL